jgi:hypothetical protein
MALRQFVGKSLGLLDFLYLILHVMHFLLSDGNGMLRSYLLQTTLTTETYSSFRTVLCCKHRVHRIATAAFLRTFRHEGKISPGWQGWGVQITFSGCTFSNYFHSLNLLHIFYSHMQKINNKFLGSLSTYMYDFEFFWN